MRDERLPLTRRHIALRCAVGHYRPAAEEPAHTIHGIRGLTEPGYAPLNNYLIPRLRFANLLAYAASA